MFLSHKWAEKSRIVLNLESAGTGGRVVLFQSGPENPWIFNVSVFVPTVYKLFNLT